MKRIFILLFSGLLVSCGGNKAEMERATYLLASGKPSDAAKAAEILERLLENSSGNERLKVLERYSGALLTMAGFSGLSLIVNVLHRESDNVASILRNIIEDRDNALANIDLAIAELEAVVGTLHNESGDFEDNVEPVVRDSKEDELGWGDRSQAASEDYQNANEELKKRLNYSAGIAHLYRGLYIFLKVTGFDDSDSFSRARCRQTLLGAEIGDEQVDSLSLSWFRARAYLARANYDDRRLGASSNNKLIDLIDDAQGGGGNTAIDADRDGFVGAAGESDQPQDEKARIICRSLDEALGD